MAGNYTEKIFIKRMGTNYCSHSFGFTLIEILITVSIIAIISLIAVVNFKSAVDKAKTIECMSNLHVLSTALNAYFTDYNHYPYADGNADIRNSNLNYRSSFGNGPAAYGYWDAVPYQLVDLHYINNENILFCPVFLKEYPDKKKYLRYAYNQATYKDEINHSHIVYLTPNSGKIWLVKCLHLNKTLFLNIPDYPDYPHEYNSRRGENVLYTDGTIEFTPK